MSHVLQLPVPEPGQLVDVRRQRYVVVDIAQSPLPPDILTPSSWLGQHLVTLSSVEDDAMGEELQVIWEVDELLKNRKPFHWFLEFPRCS